MTNLEKIWASIKHSPGSSLRDVVRRTQVPYGLAKVGIYRLRVRGNLRKEGDGRSTRWYAIGERPTDGRGVHPNSLANLDQDNDRRIARLHKANLAKGVDIVPVKRVRTFDPNQLCELQRCMMGYVSRTQDGETV